MARYKNSYDDRRSSVNVLVNSSFIREEFSRNISKGYYGTSFLEKLCRRIIMELWRRDPDKLEDISKLVANKYGDHVRKKYGSVNFRKKLTQEYNKRKSEKIRRETELQMEQMQKDILSDESVQNILDDTMFDDK